MRFLSSAIAFGLTSLSLLASSSNAQAALTWNWGYNGTGTSASGQWVSDGTTYDSTGAITYNLLSITGQNNGTPITGLNDSFAEADNKFEWNGSNILVNFNGISYNTLGSFNVFAGNSPTSAEFLPPTTQISTDILADILVSIITSSTLAPASATVPEPSSVLGTLLFGTLAAGYLVKRQMKKVTV